MGSNPMPSAKRVVALAVTAQGEMTEWSKVHDWKSCVPQGTEGSNPSLSAHSSEFFARFMRVFSVLPTLARQPRQARKGATVAEFSVWRGHHHFAAIRGRSAAYVLGGSLRRT